MSPVLCRPHDRLLGALFGGLLGIGITSLVLSALALGLETCHHRYDLRVIGFFVLCALLLGSWTGWRLEGRASRRSTWLHGLLGPGLVAYGLAVLLVGAEVTPRSPGHVLACLLAFLACSLPAVVFAVPAAWLAERFNDPACWAPGRRSRWLRRALALTLAGAAGLQTAVLLAPWRDCCTMWESSGGAG